MLTITREQMPSLRQAPMSAFAASMVDHLAAFSPPLFMAVGAAQMRVVVDFGIGRAAAHGLHLRGPVRLYLELMLLFGSHFDTDPQYPWAAEALADAQAAAPMQRAGRLYERCLDYRARVAGPEDAYTFAALRRIAALARTDLDVDGREFAPWMLDRIHDIYPQKASYVGAVALQALIREAVAGAQRQSFTSTRATALVVVLMLAFGHGCGVDPLYPWIARTLRDDGPADASARAQRLERRALTWLDHVLRHLDPELSS